MKIDLDIGARYNTRVVVSQAGKDKWNNQLYLTRCDCGDERIYRGSYLKENRNCVSCYVRTGYDKRNRMNPFDFIGQKFSELTLIEMTDKRKNGKKVGIFRCSCGTIVENIASSVLRGTLKSCGCLKLVSDMPGKRIQSFCVLEKSHRDIVKGRTYYNCICDCGKLFITEQAELYNGKKRSCGCMRWQASFKDDDAACKNKLYGYYKTSAKKRGLDFAIPMNLFVETIKSNCFYCGDSPSAIYKDHYGNPFLWTGIDRINSRLGYTANNIVPCCKKCNYAKREQTPEEFYEWIDKVYHCKMKNKETLNTEGL